MVKRNGCSNGKDASSTGGAISDESWYLKVENDIGLFLRVSSDIESLYQQYQSIKGQEPRWGERVGICLRSTLQLICLSPAFDALELFIDWSGELVEAGTMGRDSTASKWTLFPFDLLARLRGLEDLLETLDKDTHPNFYKYLGMSLLLGAIKDDLVQFLDVPIEDLDECVGYSSDVTLYSIVEGEEILKCIVNNALLSIPLAIQQCEEIISDPYRYAEFGADYSYWTHETEEEDNREAIAEERRLLNHDLGDNYLEIIGSPSSLGSEFWIDDEPDANGTEWNGDIQ